jgi:hypothetical protein
MCSLCSKQQQQVDTGYVMLVISHTVARHLQQAAAGNAEIFRRRKETVITTTFTIEATQVTSGSRQCRVLLSK